MSLSHLNPVPVCDLWVVNVCVCVSVVCIECLAPLGQDIPREFRDRLQAQFLDWMELREAFQLPGERDSLFASCPEDAGHLWLTMLVQGEAGSVAPEVWALPEVVQARADLQEWRRKRYSWWRILLTPVGALALGLEPGAQRPTLGQRFHTWLRDLQWRTRMLARVGETPHPMELEVVPQMYQRRVQR
mgnify:CR=1 FL=1